MPTPAEQLAGTKPRRKLGAVRHDVVKCLIRDKRQPLGLTIAEIANAVGMSGAGLHAVEHGRDCQITTAKKLAKFFGCTIEELWPE